MVCSLEPATGISFGSGATASAGIFGLMCKVNAWEPAGEVRETLWSPSLKVVGLKLQLPAPSTLAG